MTPQTNKPNDSAADERTPLSNKIIIESCRGRQSGKHRNLMPGYSPTSRVTQLNLIK